MTDLREDDNQEEKSALEFAGEFILGIVMVLFILFLLSILTYFFF